VKYGKGPPKTVPCPSCNEPLDPMEDMCPVCLRRRSSKEIMRGIRKASMGERLVDFFFSRSTVYFFLTLAVGYLGWNRQTYFPTPKVALGRATDDPDRKLRDETAGYRGGGSGVPAAPGGPGAPVEPVRWKIHGKVYDLISLKAVRHAAIVFKDKSSSQKFSAVTDKKGVYSVALPPIETGGYEVTVTHPDCGPVYLDEQEPPYHQLPPDRRQEEAQLFESVQILHVPFLLPEKQLDSEMNFVMSMNAKSRGKRKRG